MPPKDYYRVLGVSENATQAQIKRAYRKMAKACHPDTHAGDKAAEERFKELSEAYDALSDPTRRKKYDQLRKFGARGFQAADFRDGRPWSGAGAEGFSFEDLGGLGDLFSELFDKSGRYQRPSTGPVGGGNLETAIEVPFKTAISGGEVPVAFTRAERCSACDGSGAKPGSASQTCPDCNGLGTVAFSKGGFALSRPCPKCYGRGTLIEEPCPKCQGTGEVEARRAQSVTIPAGIRDGGKIRLQGEGQPGTRGGPSGDLILTVRVSPDRFFERRGDDIYCEVPIGIVQAALGTKIKVRTIHENKRVVVSVPPGTQSGTAFRLPGMGVHRRGRKASQYVTVRVTIPTRLSAKEREILEGFAKEQRRKKRE